MVTPSAANQRPGKENACLRKTLRGSEDLERRPDGSHLVLVLLLVIFSRLCSTWTTELFLQDLPREEALGTLQRTAVGECVDMF